MNYDIAEKCIKLIVITSREKNVLYLKKNHNGKLKR